MIMCVMKMICLLSCDCVNNDDDLLIRCDCMNDEDDLLLRCDWVPLCPVQGFRIYPACRQARKWFKCSGL
jgi:hypothetical protein